MEHCQPEQGRQAEHPERSKVLNVSRQEGRRPELGKPVVEQRQPDLQMARRLTRIACQTADLPESGYIAAAF